jgi:hypothetical protein
MKSFWYRILFTGVIGIIVSAIVQLMRFFTEFGETIENNFLAFIIGPFVLSFIIGTVIIQVWKHGMNTARMKTHACEYVIPGSLKYTLKKDNFLYSRVTKTRKQSSSTGRRRFLR